MGKDFGGHFVLGSISGTLPHLPGGSPAPGSPEARRARGAAAAFRRGRGTCRPGAARSEDRLNRYMNQAEWPDDLRFFPVRDETRSRFKGYVAEDDLVFALTEETYYPAYSYAPPRASRDLSGVARERLLKLRKKGWSEAKISRALESMPKLKTRSKPSGLNRPIRRALAHLVADHGQAALLIHKFFRNERFDDLVVSSSRHISVPDRLTNSEAVAVDGWITVNPG